MTISLFRLMSFSQAQKQLLRVPLPLRPHQRHRPPLWCLPRPPKLLSNNQLASRPPFARTSRSCLIDHTTRLYIISDLTLRSIWVLLWGSCMPKAVGGDEPSLEFLRFRRELGNLKPWAWTWQLTWRHRYVLMFLRNKSVTHPIMCWLDSNCNGAFALVFGQ